MMVPRTVGQEPLLWMSIIPSRPYLYELAESQVVYALVTITAAEIPPLPDPPLNLCLALDRSTSMQGERLNRVKAAAGAILDSLTQQDIFSVVAFSDRAQVVLAAQPFADRDLARGRISALSAGGGTEILQGLVFGLAEVHQNLGPTYVNQLILLTDGQTYGDEQDCLSLAGLAARDGITISGLGLGDEWNEDFLDELAGITGGEVVFLEDPQVAGAFLQDRVRRLSSVFAENLELSISLGPGVELLDVFKVSPEALPLGKRQTIRLGSMIRSLPVSIMFEFLIPPNMDGDQVALASLNLEANVVALNLPGVEAAAELKLPVCIDPSSQQPPAIILNALSKLNLYRLQEMARQEADQGKTEQATRRLELLGSYLLADGEGELAAVAFEEAGQLRQTRNLSSAGRKRLRYGTRALTQLTPPLRTE